nr:hypothetical protein [Tanacetum cinerariifolium]
ANQDNSPRIHRSTGYENQKISNVAGARETVGSIVVQKSGIQCYNYKEFAHVARECQKPKRAKDAAYHRKKMLLYQELEAYYTYMAQLQEVSPDAADSGPIFDAEPLQKVSNDDHYNVFATESEHPEQSKYVHDTYPIEQDAHNVIIDSLDMSYDREEIDQNVDDNDLTNERSRRRRKPPEDDSIPFLLHFVKFFPISAKGMVPLSATPFCLGSLSVLHPRSSEVEFINHMLILKLSKSNKELFIGEIVSPMII